MKVKDFIVPEFTKAMLDACVFPIIVVYERTTLDYVGFYVARLFDINRPTHYVVKTKTLGEIYNILPSVFNRIERNKSDDKNIICSWL